MKELSEKELKIIQKKVAKGQRLNEILIKEFPNAAISIIEGYDNFSYEAYIEDAYFSYSKAAEAMRKIKPNGTLSDSHTIVRETAKSLRQSDRFDEISSMMIYMSLEEKLQEKRGEK